MNINNIPRSKTQMILINFFRKLWREYVLWTRIFIINIACNFHNLPYITQRIIENTQDFAVEFNIFYGYEKSKIFELLLNNHFYISVKLLNDVKAGDTESVDIDRMLWYKNTDEIADFLSSINPNWSKAEWQDMLYGQLKALESEATCRYMTQFEADTLNKEEIEDRSLKIADYMAEGIINQFNI
jgi:hypothetical protein